MRYRVRDIVKENINGNWSCHRNKAELQEIIKIRRKMMHHESTSSTKLIKTQ